MITPDEAEKAFYEAKMIAYRGFADNCLPVNDRACSKAGFQAVIDLVTKRVDDDYAMKVLIGYDFTGQRGFFEKNLAAEDSPPMAETVTTAEQVEKGDRNAQ